MIPARGSGLHGHSPWVWVGGQEHRENRDPTGQTLGVHSLPPVCQGKFLINGV